MVRKKRLDTKILILAFFITLLIFIGGIFVGWTLNIKKVEDIDAHFNTINTEIENFQIETLFLKTFGEEVSCPLLSKRLEKINNETYKVGQKLEMYRGKKDLIADPEYRTLKSKYTRLVVTYWLLARDMKNMCRESDFLTVLYFFSKDCKDCDSQSFILTYIKKKLSEKILIFPLDADFEEPSLDVLELYYNVTEYPAMIVEDEKVVGFVGYEELTGIFCRHSANLSICQAD
jgi:hypothetical protein